MKNTVSKKINIALAAVIVLAIFIRVFRFGSVPGGMNQDGAMAAVDAAALAKYGTDRLGMRCPVHLTAWGFGQMSALMSYLMAPAVRFFGLNVTAARIPSLLVSLGGLAAMYFFARRSFGKSVALAVLFTAAVNPWHIIQSRWALDCNLFPHFLTAGMLFLVLGAGERGELFDFAISRRNVSNRGRVKIPEGCKDLGEISGNYDLRPKMLYYCLSMLCFGLSMYCYGISIYTVPVFLLAACVYLICKGCISIPKTIVCVLVWLLVSWPFIACMVINYLGLETIETPMFTIPYFPDTMRSNDILFFSKEPLAQLGRNAVSAMNILLQRYNGAVCNEVPGFGTMYLFSIPFTVLGAGALLKRFRKSTGAALTWMMFLTALLDGLITSSVNINRINLIFYPMIIFCGAGLACAYCLAARISNKIFPKIVCAVSVVLFLAGFAMFSSAYFTTYADSVSGTFMEDFGEALVAAKGHDADRYVITPDAQYDGFWYVSEVLTLFWQDIDAKEYQSGEFRERYVFRNPAGTPEPGTVYVITRKYADMFDGTDFTLKPFGRFAVAYVER